MDKNSLIQYYIQKKLEEDKKQALGGDDSLSKIKRLTSDANSIGNGLTTTGNFLKDNVNNEVAQKIGTNMANWGGNITNGAGTVSEALNAPQNYFKGVANRAVGQGLSKVGTSLAGNSGVIGKIGQSLGNLGASLASGTTAAGTGAAAGTAAGAGAAGTAATTGAAAGAGAGGAAAGGAAAGGGAASGAAAAGPIGALVALGVMALAGTNRKRAKKGASQLLSATDEMAQSRQKNNLDMTKQNMAALQEQSQQNLLSSLGGTITGGAAPIPQDNPIADYQEYLRGQGYSDDVINGIPQGLNSGDADISDWINQYNAGTGKDNPIRIPQTEEEIAAAKAGTFNTPAQTGGVSSNGELKRGLLDKFISGMTDFSRGYDENRNTAFTPENLAKSDKSKMERIGEAAGTIGRMVNKPSTQALLAGGISTALTGNPLYGMGMAQKFGNQRAMSNIHQDALAKQGIEANPGMFGAITSGDMNALMTPQYKEAMNNIALAKLEETKNYHDLMMKYYQNKLDETKEYHQGQLKNGEIRANAAQTRANNSGKSGSGKKTTTKPQDHKDWNSDLAGFTQIITNPKYVDKADVAKARFIEKYGVDPMKYIKL